MLYKQPSPFLEYLSNKYHDKFMTEVLRYLLAHRSFVESKLSDRAYLKYINLEDLDYQFVRLEDKGGNDIEFDVVVIPEIECEVTYGKHHDRDVESPDSMWLSITCRATVGETLENFKVLGVDDYTRKKREKPLAEDLVPIIPKDEYDKYAEEILTKFYPEAMDVRFQHSINVMLLAERMGISVAERPITADGSIFGQAYFKDVEAELYDRKTKEVRKVQVPKDTLIVDSDANALFSFGCQKFTVAHELVHFYLHRKAFNFAQILNNELSHIQCQVDGGLRGESRGAKNNWMEIHANGIAPCILMPKHLVIQQVGVLEKYYQRQGQSAIEYAEAIIQDIARIFDVSVYSARKRLLELGYEFAGGTLNWIDGHYVRPYFYMKGALAHDETYTVSSKDIYSKIFEGGGTSLFVAQGDFAFVENHLCVDSPKYIETNAKGEKQLTDYARTHMDECCIKFKCKSTDEFLSSSKLETHCYLCRDFSDSAFSLDIEIANNDKLLYNAEFPSRRKAYTDLVNEIKQKITFMSFTDTLNYLLEKLDVPQNVLAIDADLDEHTISRYCTGKTKVPDKRAIIAICIALHLPVDLTDIVLKQAKVSLSVGDPEDDALDFVIRTMRWVSVSDVNKALENMGFAPLTKNKK